MATIAELRARTVRLLEGSPVEERPAVDTLGAAFAFNATSLTVSTAAMWRRGDYAQLPDGELVLLLVESPSGVWTVSRAERGSTTPASGSVASGSRIVKNPPFPTVDVDQAVEDVIGNDLWPKVWIPHADEVTFAAADHLYDLPANVLTVDRVYQVKNDQVFYFPSGWWDWEQNVDPAVSATSGALRVAQVKWSDVVVYYLGRKRPTVAGVADITDEIAAVIPWGAARNLTMGRSAAGKVDPSQNERMDRGDVARDYRLFALEFDRRVDQLSRKLTLEVRPDPRFRPRVRRSW
jgi:hypothetical protein